MLAASSDHWCVHAMTRRSHRPGVLAAVVARLRRVRVRRFELRLIALGLVVAWAVAAVLVVLAYRPGGPLDVVVGITVLVPTGIAALAVVWPPLARGSGAFPLMVALGAGALLLLIPSIGGLVDQLQTLGSQTLLPSLEAAYPWFAALLGTSLFAGFGIARRSQGGTALRPRRLALGVATATAMTVLAGGLFVAVAVANDQAVREHPGASSRFGPTDLDREPIDCDARIAIGPAAKLRAHLEGDIDLRPIGSVELTGVRDGADVRWSAYVATDLELGSYGEARAGDRAWRRTPRDGWTARDVDDPAPEGESTVDANAITVALTAGNRATAEDYGIESIEGARARRCRIALDGTTFRRAFPQVRWLVGDADLSRWRGQLDYWIFLDGQVGQLVATANGEAHTLRPEAIQGTVAVRIMATERDRDLVVYPPAP